MIKINSKKIKNGAKAFLKGMAVRPFLTFCVLLLLSAIFSLILQLSFKTLFVGSVGGEESSVVKTRDLFRAETYSSVFDFWKIKKDDFQKTDGLVYPDIFQPLTKP